MDLPAEAGLGICRRGFFACVDGQFVEDPNRPMVLPSDEVCDGLDNDCNGRVDEEGSLGCVNRYPDQDGDGYGTNLATRCLCESTNRWTTDSSDCNDNDPNEFQFWDVYVDTDGDGFGVGTRPRMSAPVVASQMVMRRFLAITVQMIRISRTQVFAVVVTQRPMTTTMAHQRASMDVLTIVGKLPRGSADAALQIQIRMKTA